MKQFMILALIFSCFSISAQTCNYEMQIITIPVGNFENEIYIYDSPDHLPDVPDEGPNKFQIDKQENIYILDRRKIKKFDEDGKLIYSAQANKMNIVSFVVLNGEIWATSRNNRNEIFLNTFDNKGKLTYSFPFKKDKWALLKINQNMKVGFTDDYNDFLGYYIVDDQLHTVTERYLNNVILDFSYREKQAKVLIPEENIEIDLNEFWPNDIGQSFIGFDDMGNIFFRIYSKPLKDSKLGIVSSSGEVVDTNVVFPHYTQFGLDMAYGLEDIVSTNGIIYQMIPMKDKVEIRKWTRKE
jgi:hypothetical protein